VAVESVHGQFVQWDLSWRGREASTWRVAADKLAVVEAAYRLGGEDEAWLEQVAEAVAAQVSGSVSAHAFVVRPDEASRPAFARAYVRGVGDAPAYLAAAHQGMTPAEAAVFFGRGVVVGTLTDRLSAVAEPGQRPLFDSARARGGEEIFGAAVSDAFGHAVVVGAILRSRRRTSVAERAGWERVAVHVAAGHRLRQRLGITDLWKEASAVLTPGGQVQHAEGEAREGEARQELVRAVQAVDRARVRRSALGEAERLDLWQGLVDGRWSVVSQEDTDGRRYYVAVPNAPEAVELRKLTDRERLVVAIALSGTPHKIAGYALGLRESTVVKHLRQAMRKLGVTDRLALIRLAVGLGAVPALPVV
jgi:DNA-binding CsgD family transcriptional regulator